MNWARQKLWKKQMKKERERAKKNALTKLPVGIFAILADDWFNQQNQTVSYVSSFSFKFIHLRREYEATVDEKWSNQKCEFRVFGCLESSNFSWEFNEKSLKSPTITFSERR